jgi:plastocyanin
MPARTRWLRAAAAALGALALAGCGGAGGDTDGGALKEPVLEPKEGEPAVVEADPGGALAFDVGSIVITAGEGESTYVLRNRSGVAHDLAIRGNGVTLGPTQRVTRGTAQLTVRLTSGRYEFLCTVDGHAARGMTGTLIVR